MIEVTYREVYFGGLAFLVIGIKNPNCLIIDAPVVTASNQTHEILENTEITLTCVNEANPPAHTYTWMQDGRQLTENTTSYISTFTVSTNNYWKCN